MPLAAGTRVGPYEILAPLGAGGMGEVYRARDTKLKREVALKVLPEAFAADPERMARFQREAEVLASLNHPNIAQIYGVEERALVMELVEGESPKGPLPFEEAWKIAAQIAAGLEYAHEKGIVHRDLKPANIKVTPDGIVKLLDFGLAKAFTAPTVASGALEDSPTLTLGATQLGVILGTAAYMAPEQAKGKTVDKRADIWSFGVVLYELLTGKRLFTGDDASETLAQVLTKQPDLHPVPFQVRRLLGECLEKDPKKRLRDIGDAERQLALHTAAVSPTSRWRLAIVAAAAAVILAAALADVHFRETPAVARAIRFQIANPEKVSIAEFALSPDGHYLAFINTVRGRRLWVRALDSLEAHELPDTAGAVVPFWSPDSSNIGFWSGGKLRKIAVAGGPAVTLCDVPIPRGATWGQDGVILVSKADAILRVTDSGGVPAAVTHAKEGQTLLFPTFLPDGHFLYTVAGEQGGIMVGSLNGGAPVRLLPDNPTNAVYAPPAAAGLPGHILFLREDTLMALPFDAAKLRAVGEVFPIAEHVGAAAVGFGAFSASANGMLAYGSGFSEALTQLVWVDRSGKRLSVAVKPMANVCCGRPSLSPDDTRVAIPATTAGNTDIWLADLKRDTSFKFTSFPNVASAVWSPDGTRVAFGSRLVTPRTAIYIRSANSAGKEQMVAQVDQFANLSDWSRDGRFLVYNYPNPKTGMDLWLLPLEGDHKPIPYRLSRANEQDGVFSPDAKWMAYQSDESGPPQVWVESVPAGGGRLQISTDGGAWPVWRRDGKELFYQSRQSLIAVPMKITAAGVEPGKRETLFDGVTTRFQVSADGQRFLVSAPAEGESTAPPVTVWLNWQTGLKK